MEKHFKYVYAVLVVLVVIAINIGITRSMQRAQLTLIIDTLNVPRIMTLNMDDVVKKLLDDGASPSEVLAYIDNINKVMHHRNVILLDTKSALTIPDSYKFETVTPEQLASYLTANNITPSDAAAFDQAIKDTSAQIKTMLNP